MNSTVSVIELLSTLLAVIALIPLLRTRRARPGMLSRRLAGLLICLLISIHATSVMEASGHQWLDRFVDMIRMTVPILWLLLFDSWIKQQARASLAANEEKYRTILEDQTDFVSRWLPDGTYVFVNNAYARYLRTTTDAMVGHNFLDRLPAKDKEEILTLTSTLTPQNNLVLDKRFKELPDGRKVWQEWTNRGIFDERGRLIAIQASGRDITELVENERARLESEHLLTLAIEGAHLGMWDWHLPSGRIKYSDRWCRMLGYEPDEVEPSPEMWRRLVHPEDKERAEAAMQAMIQGKVPYYQAEYRIRTKSGAWKWVMGIGSIIERDANGVPIRVAGVPMDIDDRKRAAAEIETWKNRYEAAILASGQIMYDWNTTTGEVTTAGAVNKVLGCTPSDLATLEMCTARVHPDDQPRFIEQINKVHVTLKPLVIEYRLRHNDGHYVEVEDHSYFINDSVDDSVHMIGVLADVSERNATERHRIKTESEFAQKQKMEAIGHLAAGIAHDFSNLLTAIQGHLALAYRGIQQDHPARRSLKMVEQAAQQGVEMTRSITAFVHKAPASIAPCNLSDIATESMKMFRHLLPNSVSIVLDLPQHHAPWTMASRSQLQQVAMNLILNARDAMPEGGTLTLRVRSVPRDIAMQWPRIASTLVPHPDSEESKESDNLPPSDCVALLSVEDTGCGMDDHVMTHIFEPFFTTKDRQNGTGLGMVMVHGVVETFRGWVNVASVPGRGSRIDIILPQCDAARLSQSNDVATPHHIPPHRPRHLLLLHKRNFVGEIMSTTIESSGYVVLFTESADELLNLAAEHRGELAVAIIDADMLPQREDQAPAVFALLDQLPAIPTVVLTANTAQFLDEPQAQSLHILPRPFQMSRLIETVDQAVGLIAPGTS